MSSVDWCEPSVGESASENPESAVENSDSIDDLREIITGLGCESSLFECVAEAELFDESFEKGRVLILAPLLGMTLHLCI